jgi:TetR/AcrR family transcriptional regulator, cholesterol catabolism regulator
VSQSQTVRRVAAPAAAPKGALNEERWAEIIDAAFEILAEKGYEATTIQVVAARVGLLKGSLYYYIQSKEDLLFAVIERAHIEALAWLRDDPVLAEGDAVTRIRRFIARWMQNVERQAVGFVLNEREAHHLSADHQRVLNRYTAQISLILRSILIQGQSEGSFRTDMRPEIAAFSIFRMLNGTVMWPRSLNRRSWAEFVSWYQGFVLLGLGYTPDA